MFRASLIVLLTSIAETSAADARSHRVTAQLCPAPPDAAPIAPARDAGGVGGGIGAIVDGPLIFDVKLTSPANGLLYKRILIDLRAGALSAEKRPAAPFCE